ncbi:MAG: hypothetical protein NXI00_24175 [Cytophagales bacterium]|nr:hypothetical protein [Cytophagales bacterium]
MQSYGFELYHLLDDYDYAEFVVRWNLFRFKLKECGEDMSLHEWTDAYHFVRSAHKDAEVLLQLLLKAQDSVSSILQCDNVSIHTCVIHISY